MILRYLNGYLSRRSCMVASDGTANSRLRRIAGLLGISVAALSDPSVSGDGAGLDELLHLWIELKTPAARAATLDAMRQIIDQQDDLARS